jgi:putative membrane protein
MAPVSVASRLRDPRAWLAGFAAFTALTLIAPPWPREQLLQHMATAAGVACFLVAGKLGASRMSLAAFLGFLALHVFGARWVYSYVPYADWSEALFGVRVGERLGFARNHYDRFVHAMYGVLVTPLCADVLLAMLGPRDARAEAPRGATPALALLAVLAIAGTSAVYEICEWAFALAVAPERAERYLGQQGDAWDAQKDMALAVAGSIASAVVLVVRRRR